MSESHLSSSQTQPKLNGDSGVNMSPPPINLKTHPSLRRCSNEGNGSVGHTIQHSVSQDASYTSGSSQIDDDLQFSCGHETPSPNSDKSSSNEQLDEGFRPRAQQLSNSKEQYEVMRHPKTESAPPAPTSTSNYVHMSKMVLPASNYVNYVIPADMKAPVDNYENAGFNTMSVPPIPIQEGATRGSYENYSHPDVNTDIKPPSSAAPMNNYQNVNLDPLASPRMNTHERVMLKKTERKILVKDRPGNLQYVEIDNGIITTSPPKL